MVRPSPLTKTKYVARAFRPKPRRHRQRQHQIYRVCAALVSICIWQLDYTSPGPPTISWQPCSCTRYTAQLLFKRMSSHNCAPHLAVFRCLSDARAKVRMTCVQSRHSHRCNCTWWPCVASRGPSALVPTPRAPSHFCCWAAGRPCIQAGVSLSCAHFLQQAALGIMSA